MMVTKRILIDTDCGPDDFLALAILFSNPDVVIVGVSIVHGMSDIEFSLRNIKKFLSLIGKSSIPIFIGFNESLNSNRIFPLAWKEQSNELKGVLLPEPCNQFKILPLDDVNKLEVTDLLAIGPLTNVNYMLKNNWLSSSTSIYIMGGAFNVKGNLFTTSDFNAPNDIAEWNFYADSASAHEFFNSVRQNSFIIPLDVTNQVPFDIEFFEKFRTLNIDNVLYQFSLQIFENSMNFIKSGEFFAWDPLAALAITVPELIKYEKVKVNIDTAKEVGNSTYTHDEESLVQVAVKVNPKLFYEQFIYTF